MQSLTIFLTHILSGFIGSYIAIRKNKSPVTWFIIGFLFGFIGIIILIILQDKRDNENNILYRTQKDEIIEETTILQEEEIQKEITNCWFFLNENKQTTGPLSLYTICKNISQKEHPEQTWLWKKGMKNWQRLEEIPEALEQLKNIKQKNKITN